ncbi:CpaF family protein [Acetivibrio ethanolgignens]|uniref:Pilus assembly protein n=1 Tax=Acetivibrio ethanolgignens TaxID=290052 RepID=A0A0V8QF78_9FIRM|nr:CpaF family protein [Acetivibrio ethanolgignens]KSV59233.1 pilus assembly protein [Acetivibrio ethanolgignens]
METGKQQLDDLKKQWQEELKEELCSLPELTDEAVKEQIERLVAKRGREAFLNLEERRQLGREIFNSIRRLDILQELLEDEEVTEIMVNGPESIFIEKHGRIEQWNKRFESEDKLIDVVQQMAAAVNRRVNEANPIMDARLLDGSRVNVVLNPVALQGTAVTIRKFSREPFTMKVLQELGAISSEGAVFLKELTRAGYNIFVSGGTGSGKTTFLNALAEGIPGEERVITIEDSAELDLKIKNLVALEARPANIEGKNEIRIRDLIKSALRMRPSRIIVGEVRDDAAVDMLQAMNTGHDGSLSTGHANSPEDMLHRLETLVLMGMDIPLLAIRQQIASALEIIVHLGRLRDGSRRVLEITEVVGLFGEAYQMNSLFVFEEEGMDEEGKIKGSLKRTENPFLQREKLCRVKGEGDGL